MVSIMLHCLFDSTDISVQNGYPAIGLANLLKNVINIPVTLFGYTESLDIFSIISICKIFLSISNFLTKSSFSRILFSTPFFHFFQFRDGNVDFSCHHNIYHFTTFIFADRRLVKCEEVWESFSSRSALISCRVIAGT